MRKSNGAVIWLLFSGAAMGFALSLILASMLFLNYLIPIFILLVIAGYLTTRVIGRAGGEFSDKAKNYSIILEGFVIGIVFDLMRFRYDWLINVFKYIAIGTFFILMSFVLNRNLEKYSENYPNQETHLGILRPSILWILTGFNFALTINTIIEAYLGSGYFIGALPALVLFTVIVMFLSKAEYDLLDARSGVWVQLFTGAALGVGYDLAFFRVILWQDLLKLFVVSIILAITAGVIRMKKPAELGVGEVDIQLEDRKRKKKSKVVGEISLKSKSDSKSSSRKKKRRK